MIQRFLAWQEDRNERKAALSVLHAIATSLGRNKPINTGDLDIYADGVDAQAFWLYLMDSLHDDILENCHTPSLADWFYEAVME